MPELASIVGTSRSRLTAGARRLRVPDRNPDNQRFTDGISMICACCASIGSFT